MVTKLNMVKQLTAEQQARSNIVVAASGFTMADGQSQDPLLAQVRMRNGDMVYVKDLPAIDSKNRQPNGDYTIPLVLNHSGKVEDQVGAVWLFIENGLLHGLIVWVDNEKTNQIKPIAEAGFMQFSTEGYVDDVDENGKYGNFWISTLSPVTVGNDPATQVLNQSDGKILVTNAMRFDNKGETMSKDAKNEITPEERDSLKQEIKSELLAELSAEEEVVNDADETETEVEETTTEEETEKEEEVTTNKVSTTPKAPIANARPKQPTIVVKNDMSGDGAMDAFVNGVREGFRNSTYKGGLVSVMEDFKKANAITGSAILPTKIAETFFKAWIDNDALSAFRFMNSKVGAVYAATTSNTAMGHKKGDAKTEQTLNLVRRDLKALALYKKLIIDKQDIFDDESGNLVRFRAEELVDRITNQILVAALIGGTVEGSVTSADGEDVRGLFGIIPDAAAGSGFGSYVATEVTGVEDESAYDAAVRTVGAVVRSINGNVTSNGRSSSDVTLFVPYSTTGDSWITRFLLSKNETGGALYPSGTNLEEVLRVKNIVEVPELEESGSLIAVADGAYQLYGEKTPEMYPFFDTVYNKDTLLAEQYIAGSLAGYKQAAVYVPADES